AIHSASASSGTSAGSHAGPEDQDILERGESPPSSGRRLVVARTCTREHATAHAHTILGGIATRACEPSRRVSLRFSLCFDYARLPMGAAAGWRARAKPRPPGSPVERRIQKRACVM